MRRDELVHRRRVGLEFWRRGRDGRREERGERGRVRGISAGEERGGPEWESAQGEHLRSVSRFLSSGIWADPV